MMPQDLPAPQCTPPSTHASTPERAPASTPEARTPTRPAPHTADLAMTKYLISFPALAMDIPDGELAAVGEAARAVIREAKRAGAYVFGGGINEGVAPLMVQRTWLRPLRLPT